MIPVTEASGKRIALFGLGGSGLVTCRALLAGGADLIAFDDNPVSVKTASKEGIPTGDLRTIDWANTDALVLAPGVPLTHPQPHWSVDLAARHQVPVIGDVELFFRQMEAAGRRAPVVAITGTNGKSTTTALIAHVLKSAGRDVQMGGNIGRAVLDLDPVQEGAEAANQVYVVECSSYQIDTTPSLNAHVGVLLNITPDHLERHGTIENYAAIKERLVASADLAVIAADDDFTRAITQRRVSSGKPLLTVAVSDESNADITFANGTVFNEGEPVADIAEVGSLRGIHNGQNASCAYGVCSSLGLSDTEIAAGFSSFPGLAHRMQQVGTVQEVVFINDSKGTNAEAAATALSSFERVYWIAGGLPKEGGIEALAPLFGRVAKAYLIGEAAGTFAAQIGDTIPYEISGTLKQAVNHAAADAAAAGGEQIVLLSPAAASFDQFPNFEKRGEAFTEAVVALEGFAPIEG